MNDFVRSIDIKEKNKMKKSKILIPAVALMAFSVAAAATGTVAWFSANREVMAKGMKVTATTEGALVITNTTSLPQASESQTVLNYGNSSAVELAVSTHDDDSETFLSYVSDAEHIDAATGLKRDDFEDDLTMADAVADTHFVDYTAYIAATGRALEDQDITVTLPADAAITTLMGATSVDFYYLEGATAKLDDPADGTFLGTLNLAQLDAEVNDAETGKTELVMEGVDVPQAGEGSAIAILMRVYIDGALLDQAEVAEEGTEGEDGYVAPVEATTFVKNIDVADIENTSIFVNFVAEDAE